MTIKAWLKVNSLTTERSRKTSKRHLPSVYDTGVNYDPTWTCIYKPLNPIIHSQSCMTPQRQLLIRDSSCEEHENTTRTANTTTKTEQRRVYTHETAHPVPTYLNQFGLQSSLFSHASPSVKRPVTHPLHFGLFGQLKKGICW